MRMHQPNGVQSGARGSAPSRLRPGVSERWLPSPTAVFLVLGATFGSVLFMSSPPFRWGDESTHFRQAFRLAEGDLRPACSHPQANTLPRGIVQLVYFVSVLPKHGLVSREGLRGLGFPVNSEDRVAAHIVRAPYSPLPYASQAIAIAVTWLVTS